MNIKSITVVDYNNINKFLNELDRVYNEMQDNNLDVEIQYSRCNTGLSALVVGRAKYEIEK